MTFAGPPRPKASSAGTVGGSNVEVKPHSSVDLEAVMRRLTSAITLLLLAAAAGPVSATAASGTTIGGPDGQRTFVVRAIGTDSFRAAALNNTRFAVGTDRATGHAAVLNLRTGVQTDLGTLGGYQSEGTALNDAGQVVGYADLGGGPSHAFVWSFRTGKMTDLGTLGGDFSYATAINNRGQVVGSSSTASGDTHAFVWDPRTRTMTDLGTLGGIRSTASDINERGQIVGDSAAPDVSHAVLWSARSHRLTDLGLLPDVVGTSATSINDRGDVVGFGNNVGDYTSRSFIWSTRTRVMRPLQVLAGQSTEAAAINDRGYVVGTVVSTDWQDQACWVWNARTGSVTFLPTLDESSFSTWVYDVNNALRVVGGSGGRSALWTPAS